MQGLIQIILQFSILLHTFLMKLAHDSILSNTDQGN